MCLPCLIGHEGLLCNSKLFSTYEGMIFLSRNIDELAINTIRTLSIDSIEKANSGHPGMPMGAAPMAYSLWAKYMNHNPSNPEWFNRDRFV